MISIFSKTNISVDLDKFINQECNKLLIVGESGAGKSTTAKYFSEKFNVPYISTDKFFWENIELRKKDPLLYREKRKLFEYGLIMNDDRLIIEGVGIHRMPIDLILNSPTIILGKSGLVGAFHAGLRNKKNSIGTGKFFPEFKVAFWKNFNELSKSVNDYRKQRIKILDSKVEIIEIPFLLE